VFSSAFSVLNADCTRKIGHCNRCKKRLYCRKILKVPFAKTEFSVLACTLNAHLTTGEDCKMTTFETEPDEPQVKAASGDPDKADRVVCHPDDGPGLASWLIERRFAATLFDRDHYEYNDDRSLRRVRSTIKFDPAKYAEIDRHVQAWLKESIGA
jgi:hypothetical protein